MTQTASLTESCWSTLDSSPNADSFVSYLRDLERVGSLTAYRSAVVERIPYRPGDLVLDAGCGIGTDTRFISRVIGRTGLVVGVDASRRMLHTARNESSDLPNSPSFGAASVTSLPFPSGTFDGAFCSRVLMHLPDPGDGIREMLRVLKPGGWLALTEPDWSRTRLMPESEIGRMLIQTHCASFANGSVGGTLATLVLQHGGWITDASLESHTFDSGFWKVTNLGRAANRAIEAGTLTRTEMTDWMRTNLESGTLRLEMAAGLCIARKPGDGLWTS